GAISASHMAPHSTRLCPRCTESAITGRKTAGPRSVGKGVRGWASIECRSSAFAHPTIVFGECEDLRRLCARVARRGFRRLLGIRRLLEGQLQGRGCGTGGARTGKEAPARNSFV